MFHRTVLTIACSLLIINAPLRAQDQASVNQIVRASAKVIARHLSQKPFDDSQSEKAFQAFFLQLDPSKQYFLRADVDRFDSLSNRFDDMLSSGSLSPIEDILTVYKLRVSRYASVVEEFLRNEKSLDLDSPDHLVLKPEAIDFSKNEAEFRERIRLQLKYDVLYMKVSDTANKFEWETAKRRLSNRYQRWNRDVQNLNERDLAEYFLNAVLRTLDESSYYTSPLGADDLAINTGKPLVGIGAQLKMQDGQHIIEKVTTGGPAQMDGTLQPNDWIVSVGQGTNGKMVDVREMKLAEMVRLIRGESGSVVRIGYLRPGKSKTSFVELKRNRIQLETATVSTQVFDTQAGNNKKKIGIINLPSFYADTTGTSDGEAKSSTSDVRFALKQFNEKGVDVAVIDLRTNGGGLLTESISLTGLFIDSGPVLQVRTATGDTVPYRDDNSGTAWSKPLAVVVSPESASASEIFAGAIQDYGRGIIIGDEATYGKGTVQNIFPLGKEIWGANSAAQVGTIVLTTQQFYRPGGDSPEHRGVQSDLILPTGYIERNRNSSPSNIRFDRVSAVGHSNYGLLNTTILNVLRSNSQSRVRKSSQFQSASKLRELQQKIAGEILLPLNENELSRRNEMNQQITASANAKSTENIVDFYLEEVCLICFDYVNQLPKSSAPATSSVATASYFSLKPAIPEQTAPAQAPAQTPAPDPSILRLRRSREIDIELLNLERKCDNLKDEIRRWDEQISQYQRVIGQAQDAAPHADTFLKGFIVGAAGGYAISQKVEAEQARGRAQYSLDATRRQIIELKQEQNSLTR